jgi:hypothetical protein
MRELSALHNVSGLAAVSAEKSSLALVSAQRPGLSHAEILGSSPVAREAARIREMHERAEEQAKQYVVIATQRRG